MIPNLPQDYIIGHEPIGVVEEIGPEVRKVNMRDRVIIPFNVSRGEGYYCKHGLTSQCDNSNPYGESSAYSMRYNGRDITNENVNLRTGQAPVIPYMRHLYNLLVEGKVDLSDIITYKLPLDEAEHNYEVFDTKTEDV